MADFFFPRCIYTYLVSIRLVRKIILGPNFSPKRKTLVRAEQAHFILNVFDHWMHEKSIDESAKSVQPACGLLRIEEIFINGGGKFVP
jgi:hypothetical protein